MSEVAMPLLSAQNRGRRVTVSVDVVVEGESAHYVAETGNLSETGLCLHTKKAFPVGTRLRLVFGLPPRLPRIDAVGTVRWSGNGHGVGVEFTSLAWEHKQALVRFLYSAAQ